ncbi:uncharacterized protein LOC131155460 [Malania oleifera]|uniref:uncharacterized protein LOC131155460 n=1 Tax=Malania oleifera TaxID=397392 RepID=UPI0025ADBA40|nr:uncharacterized protein LOC131155460 [Malania oleifera]
MGMLSDSWCFCNGGGKSERMKAAIYSGKGPAMARISTSGSTGFGTGFLIHRNLLLTTHAVLPSVATTEAAEIRLQDGVAASLNPHRFFITSSVLDLTIVGLDATDGDSTASGQQPHHLKTSSKPNLDLGSVVYLLGFTGKKVLTVGEGKVVIATDNLIKLSTDEVTWSPGSAGFDVQGNLAFMICDPMKLATSPNTKSSTTSSSSSASWKKDLPMQFGIPIPIICDWLNQHWEGSLDELNKPKLPIIRLMSTGQKSEHSSASFTLRRVFKSTEAENNGTPSSSNIVSKPRDQPGPSCSVAAPIEKETFANPHGTTHVQGIPTPEIFESPKVTAAPVRKKESVQIQLLDINFPPKVDKATALPGPAKGLLSNSDENCVEERPPQNLLKEDGTKDNGGLSGPQADVEVASTGSVNGAHSEVQSSSSPVDASMMQNGDSSEGETMYSAETAESRNYTTPREAKCQPVGRSQSWVGYNRWENVHRNTLASQGFLENQKGFGQGKRMHSQGATSQRSNDYYSPTLSSIMKKRNSSEQPNRPRQSAVHSSPRWMF